jgi:nucleotide-binding universal stress UspA family protein
MLNTILVPLDETKQAEAILCQVEDAAKHNGSKVIFLKVEKEPLMLDWDEVVDLSKCRSAWDRREKRAESYLAACKEKFRKKGIEAHTRVEYGSVVKSILRVAEFVHADLIAMASHGLNDRHHMSLGSIAAKVFECTDRPLLLVRSAGKN